MKLFHRKDTVREAALSDIRRFIVTTSLSSNPQEQKFRVFGLQKFACHEVVVNHTKLSPYTLTSVGVRNNEGKERFTTIQFFWVGVHIPMDLLDRIVGAFAVLFPEKVK